MALANAIKGARHTPQTITWTDADGNPQDLTNATISGLLRDQASGVQRAIEGELVATDAANGEFTWEYAAADVAEAGDYEVQFLATYPDDTFYDATFVTTWSVFELLADATPTILTREEAATVLRCEDDDLNMLELLPLVDDYIETATGHDWAADSPVHAKAKSAARMLLVRWHEDPGGLGAGNALGFGLQAALVQLEALALRYRTFEGLPSAGYIYLPGVCEGDSVSSVVGVQGASGDQAASFETVISESNYIRQTSGSDLEDMWFRALITPVNTL